MDRLTERLRATHMRRENLLLASRSLGMSSNASLALSVRGSESSVHGSEAREGAFTLNPK